MANNYQLMSKSKKTKGKTAFAPYKEEDLKDGVKFFNREHKTKWTVTDLKFQEVTMMPRRLHRPLV